MDPTGKAVGVTRQEKLCRQLAADRGWDVAAVYVDNDVSAYSGAKRPGYEQALDSLGPDTALVAYHPDRLTRNPTDLETLVDRIEQTGAVVATVSAGDVDLSTATGRGIARVVGALARMESERTAERVSAAAKSNAENGKGHTGRRPLGYRFLNQCPGGEGCGHPVDCEGSRVKAGERSGGLELHPVEAPMLQGIARRLLAGQTLASESSKLPGRKTAAMTSIRRALINPRAAGLVTYRGEVVAQGGPVLLDRDTWEALVALFSDPRRRGSTGARGTALGGGMLRCGRPECGGPMALTTVRGVRRYICSRYLHFSRSCHFLEDAVLPLVGEVLRAMEESGVLSLPEPYDDLGMTLRADVNELEARLDTLAVLFSSGELAAPDYAKATAQVRSRLEQAAGALAKRVRRPALGDNPRRAWDLALSKGDLPAIQRILRALLVSITLEEDRTLTLVWQPDLGEGLPTRL